MKVLSINLNTYQEERQMDKFMRIANEIVNRNIDVILFCEAGQSLMAKYVEGDIRNDNAVKIICDKVNEILGSQVYKFKWEMVHFGFKIYEEGVAIMSKLPLENIESKYISQTSDVFTFKSRKILKATIDNVDFYSCHLGWEDDEKEPFSKQMELLDQFVDKNRFSILGGTFNNDVKTKSYRQIASYGYVDLYVKHKPEGRYDETFILPEGFNKRDNYRLDYVFASNDKVKVNNACYLFEKNDRVSDHVAIFVEFEAE